MKILTGQLPPDSGEVVVGQTIKIGYYAQEIGSGEPEPATGGTPYIDVKTAAMDPTKRVIDYIRDTAEYVQTKEGSISASPDAGTVSFSRRGAVWPDRQAVGREKRRLNLLRVLMEAPNVLILDVNWSNLFEECIECIV